MNYFITDIKSMVRSTSFQLLFFVSAVVMILDPITMYFVLGNSKGYFEELGTNFYRHWILMNYSWGNRLFCSLFFAIPCILPGLVYYHEQKSSVRDLLVTRGTWKQYFLSKVFAQILTAFFTLLLLFVINGIVTGIFFPVNGPLIMDQVDITPIKESFAYSLFVKSPMLVVLIYWFLVAAALALLSLNTMAILSVIHFKNIYLTLLVPFVVYTLGDMLISKYIDWKYSLLIMMQPSATWSVTDLYTSWSNWGVIFGVLILADVVLLLIGYRKGKESI